MQNEASAAAMQSTQAELHVLQSKDFAFQKAVDAASRNYDDLRNARRRLQRSNDARASLKHQLHLLSSIPSTSAGDLEDLRTARSLLHDATSKQGLLSKRLDSASREAIKLKLQLEKS